jgi:hypothetical protein
VLLTAGASLYLAFLCGSAAVQAGTVGVLSWMLLFGACRSALNVFRAGGRCAVYATIAGHGRSCVNCVCARVFQRVMRSARLRLRCRAGHPAFDPAWVPLGFVVYVLD